MKQQSLTCTHLEIREQTTHYLQSINRLVLGQHAQEVSIMLPKYGGIKARFVAFALFTSTGEKYILSVENLITAKGTLMAFEGEWDSDVAIKASYPSITACFPGLSQSTYRGLLVELLAIMYRVLTIFDSQDTDTDDNSAAGINSRMTVDCYEILTDVEWIEDMMHEYDRESIA
ncbi:MULTISPECIES: hypothetical protein [Paenibacillus]|uniref:Uncharacterized protein n=1 Tax=Paenibacillus odorifer TaxID=189426 RepID=A0A1R0X1U1_9BACL|nr:hypothetical protein [Paenibacillus odorifer]OMD26753.1 hypothetical protein BJP51_26545 [Paenibacillus odorifer]OME30620.1 hypothetical protein BSK63_17150 [Paenibacillus odorifer]